MNTTALFSQIETLPDSLKLVVAQFVQHLVAAEAQVKQETSKKKPPKFGLAQGMFIIPPATGKQVKKPRPKAAQESLDKLLSSSDNANEVFFDLPIVDWHTYLKDKDLSKYKPGFGGAKGMFEMSPDFDEPLEDLKEYMY